MSRRTRSALLPVLAAAVTIAATAGCQNIDSAQRVVDRARLVNDLASKLDQAAQKTYSAEYTMPGGAQATIAQAQDPVRVAYTFPSGKFMTTPEGTTACSTAAAPGSRMRCEVTLPPSPSTPLDPAALDKAGGRGFVPPTLVVGLLTAASLDTDAAIQQSDTTIAGRHAICVSVKGLDGAAASSFDACITDDGVLGSFTGIVAGAKVDLTLTRYGDTVPADAFEPPPGAEMVDRRPK